MGETGFNNMFFAASLLYGPEFLEQKKKELGRLFSQEYPETPEEAFITSGDTYFDKDAMQDYLKNTQEVMA